MRGLKIGFGLCVCFLFIFGSCLCKFVVVKNSLRVNSPVNIKGTYECAMDNSSVVILSGVVLYPEVNRKACKSFIDPLSFKTNNNISLPVFLLADRGDCYFVLKAWNAQNAGAAAILIADYMQEPLLTMEFPTTHNIPYLKNITIPMVFITQSLGNLIKKSLNINHDFVNINLDWTEEPDLLQFIPMPKSTLMDKWQ